MKALFAPWRMAFIEKHDSSKGCILCQIVEQNKDDEQLVLKRGEVAYVVMNKYPYANGHLMIVPYRHLATWTSLNPTELLEIQTLTQEALTALGTALNPHGFNIGTNLGRAAGAGIEDHVHQHIVPRWVGDINFMPLFSETKVISEHLEASYLKIKKAWGL